MILLFGGLTEGTIGRFSKLFFHFFTVLIRYFLHSFSFFLWFAVTVSPLHWFFFILLFVLRMKLLPDLSKTFGDFLIIFYIVKQCVFDDLSFINFMKISLRSYFSTISLQFLYSLCSKLLRIFQNSIIFTNTISSFLSAKSYFTCFANVKDFSSVLFSFISAFCFLQKWCTFIAFITFFNK